MTEYELGYRKIREAAACLAERASEDCDDETAAQLRGVAHDIRCMPVPNIPPAPDDEALVALIVAAITKSEHIGLAAEARAVIAAIREAGALRHE